MDELGKYSQRFLSSKDEQVQASALDYFYTKFQEGKVIYPFLIKNKITEALANIINTTINEVLLQKALLIINNIIARCNSAQCREIVKLDFVVRLVELIESDHPDIQEQAIWILDNLAVEGYFRLQIIEYGAVDSIVKVLEQKKQPPKKEIDLIGAKALSTFTSGGVFSSSNHATEVISMLRIIVRLLNTPHTQTTITSYACCTLANLTEVEEQDINDEVFALPQIPARLAELIKPNCKIQEVQTPAVDALSHLATSTEEHISQLVELGVMPSLYEILAAPKQKITTSIRVLRCVSHICAGASDAIQAAQDVKLFPLLFDLVRNNNIKNFSVRLHAAYCVLFACHGANLLQTRYLVELGLIPLLCDLLVEGGSKEQKRLVMETLRSLEALLGSFNFVTDFDHVNALFVKSFGWERVMGLRKSKDPDVSREANKLDEKRIRDSYLAPADTAVLTSVASREEGQNAREVSDVPPQVKRQKTTA